MYNAKNYSFLYPGTPLTKDTLGVQLYLYAVDTTAGFQVIQYDYAGADTTNAVFSPALILTGGDTLTALVNTLLSAGNSTGNITFFVIQENTLNKIYEIPSDINNIITSGDFDGDGIDEIIIRKQNDGHFIVYKTIAGIPSITGDEYFPVNEQNNVMCSVRFSNFSQSDALVCLRPYERQITIFNMDGLCPGLNLSNQTIDDSYTIDNIRTSPPINNNYPIDYHVNSTLVAGGGYNIVSPSIVDMSSGKEIEFKPGFSATAGCDLHAYIAPALECSSSIFKKNTPHPPQNNNPHYSSQASKTKTIENKDIAITPNPNNGSFQIAVTKNDTPVGIKEVKVFDMMGKVIWETGASQSNIFNIDITNYSGGIYYIKSINEFGELEMKKLIKQ